MNEVRIGVIGAGNMGAYHAKYIIDGQVPRCSLTAVADANPANLEKFPDIKGYTDSAGLIRSGEVDAVLIATPHYFHTTVGIDALQNGLHVLVEKPISVHKADARRLIAARKSPDQVFAVMFCLRTMPRYKKIKSILESGALGDISRINWIATDWFRTDAYYASGGWRATWKGEGGGVLLNQCPHQLDLLQWLVGMPVKVHGFCRFGKWHDIEVEDDVTAYLEYANGATGVFVTTTGEAPGINRLEIVGDKGRLLLEDSRLTFVRNEISAAECLRKSASVSDKPDVWNIGIPLHEEGLRMHQEITRNFVNAILDGEELLAPGDDGLNSVELANAMIYSALTKGPVNLPLDGEKYEALLNRLIEDPGYARRV